MISLKISKILWKIFNLKAYVIKNINFEYREKNEATDVLQQLLYEKEKIKFVCSPNEK